jgi:predicted TPR repeat methyltransferase
MHDAALDFVRQYTAGQTFEKVLEFGSRDINGSVRPYVVSADYWGIDLAAGKGVDEVADAAHYNFGEPVDLVICCEVLEHTPAMPEIVANAARHLEDKGLFLITCATDWREPHSGYDGGEVRRFEYYRNVSPQDLVAELDRHGFTVEEIEIHEDRGDLYVAATRLP